MRKKRHKLLVLICILGIGLVFQFGRPDMARADVSHCGTLSGDEIWLATDNVHIVTCDVIIPDGITLTIEAGAILKFQADTRLYVNGALDAQGTAADQIVFTSFQDDAHGGDTDGDGEATPPAKYDWGWIEFGDSSDDAASALTHCLVLYGGHDYIYPTHYNHGAITLYDAEPTVADCAFQYNHINGIEIPGGTKTATASNNMETWHNTDVVYTLSGDLTIAEGMNLVIDPGVTVKFMLNSRLRIQGVLDARGTLTDTITFTSFNDDAHGGDTDDDGTATPPNPDDWAWIEFNDTSDDAASFLEHCVLLYGGHDYVYPTHYYYGVVRLVGASPTISDCAFSYNSNYAIGADTGSFPTVSGNTMTNNGINGIGL
jgi:hypothetical protein